MQHTEASECQWRHCCQIRGPTQAKTFSCSDDEEDAISEDLDAALHSLQALTAQVSLGRDSILVPAPHA